MSAYQGPSFTACPECEPDNPAARQSATCYRHDPEVKQIVSFIVDDMREGRTVQYTAERIVRERRKGSRPCGPECNGTWPAAPGESPRAFHVKDCPNDPAARGSR